MEKQTDEKQSLWAGWSSPPNLVTFSRIILVVVFLGLYIAAGPWGLRNVGMRWAAAIIFLIAASTDKLDGWLARKYNQVTELGKLMDPIADKLLTLGALVVAACYGELGNVWVGWIVTGLFLLREIGITVMRFFVMERPGGKVIAAAWPGKLKTLFQCIGLAMLLLPAHIGGPAQGVAAWVNVYYIVTYVMLYVALVLCLYSGGIYLYNTFVGSRRNADD